MSIPKQQPIIYLASKSPRRRTLLEQIGVPYKLINIDIPEQQAEGETALAYIKRVTCDKARAASQQAADLPILAADTEVVLDGQILGKPADHAAAMQMLRTLSGREHEVISAVALLTTTGQLHTRVNKSTVHFKTLSEAECEAYCQTDEPWDKAGGYAIQGKAAAFITKIEGSYSGIMGLPLHETAELLAKLQPKIPHPK
ncbi:MAG: Maf family protein [Pseudohongiellaceae bacterium]